MVTGKKSLPARINDQANARSSNSAVNASQMQIQKEKHDIPTIIPIDGTQSLSSRRLVARIHP